MKKEVKYTNSCSHICKHIRLCAYIFQSTVLSYSKVLSSFLVNNSLFHSGDTMSELQRAGSKSWVHMRSGTVSSSWQAGTQASGGEAGWQPGLCRAWADFAPGDLWTPSGKAGSCQPVSHERSLICSVALAQEGLY